MSPPIEPASSSAQSTLPATRKPKEAAPEPRHAPHGKSPTSLAWLADAGLIALFLALTFLLGVFPLKDADIYWHLRTGDWIRQMGRVPQVDLFTFTREGVPWIDLHWIFQVSVSWLYEHGGVVALNLAKCSVTCVAVLLLVTARRRDWPVWVMLVAWLPAVLVLGGRIYVRPETLTLLYLSIFLAVLTRWDRHPFLAAIVLPIVQVAWVNSHGLFVLGPIVVVFALMDATVRRGAFAPERRRWWGIVGIGSLFTFAACLVNPYGIVGALYPIQLAGTMGNPVFSQYVAELTPIPVFIQRAGIRNLPLQLHLVTMALGALSFLLPLVWVIGINLFGARIPIIDERPDRDTRSTSKAKGQRKARSKKGERKNAVDTRRPNPGEAEAGAGWRLSPFRFLLFTAFSLLSLQATRNSHQFAAVVGSVTAWNFGEWAAAIRRRRVALSAPRSGPDPSTRTLRLVAAIAISWVLIWVGSGWFYEMTGEKRTISLKEDAFFFPHEAARFAGRPEMPERFLSFHNAHASLFEYYHGPERKVYTDPRLEVAGPELFERYMKLETAIREEQAGWQGQLDRIGRPVILVDHEYSAKVGATLFGDARWRCVWFDSIAAVFVHDSATEAVRQHAVDFAARHFHPDPADQSRSIPELAASALALRLYLSETGPIHPDLARPLAWLGLDDTRRMLRAVPELADGWKLAGQIELCREPTPNSPRYRLPFDPVFDLSIVRATYALRRGWELSPNDFTTLYMLILSYEQRLMYEAALPMTEQLVSRYPINRTQATYQESIRLKLPEYQKKLGTPPPSTWRNRAELDQIVTSMLGWGRAESAADLLEKGYPPEEISWDVLDRIATLRLHLGEPARARAFWQKAASAPESAVATARIGTTYLVEGDFEAARRAYREALRAKPDLFEAFYSLAVLEQDAGDATASYELAQKAIATAKDDLSRSAARTIANGVAPFAKKTQAVTTERPPAESARPSR